ncbi:L-threonine 3-dehydrogenase [Stieleria maiorica]|uniref:alcohol dehydrogenase n=1 Tax=Stieleria maiorica TaxID=2795974 RepID=A0A5B9MEH7_9BACT|nr:zinc-binding dehydrogenase [Stieleria maiorica]QEF98380.1 L-threonine 3-dehydrogenase [Stieleria maiorica]
MSEHQSSQSSPDQSRTCLAAVFHGAGRPLKLQSFPRPMLQAGEALVRVRLCTICGSDLHTLKGLRIEPTPSILAHEVVGEIVDVGQPGPRDLDQQPLRRGDRVTWSICVSCSDCDRCRSGLPQKCRRLVKYGHSVAEGREALSGGLAEYILLRSGTAIAKLPADVPDEVASPINCATSTIAAAYRAAGDVDGQRVMVFGAGMLGLTAVAMGRELGATQVVICDVDQARLTLAERFGATDTITVDSIASIESSFDVLLECSGAPEAIEAACRIGDVGSRVILVGSVMNSRPVQLDPTTVVRKWMTIAGVHNYAPMDLYSAIDFISRCHDKYPFAELVAKTYALTDINAAIDHSLQHRPIRVAVRPEVSTSW